MTDAARLAARLPEIETVAATLGQIGYPHVSDPRQPAQAKRWRRFAGASS